MNSLGWPVSIFADEAAGSFADQLAFVKAEGFDAIEVRHANGRNVSEFLDSDVQEIKDSGFPVHCIGSPVNKIHFDLSKELEEFDKFKRCIDVANRLDCERIRIFAPEPPARPADSRPYLDWLAPMAEWGKSHGVIVLLENDGLFFGAYPDEAKTAFEELAGSHFKAIFDFSNCVLIGGKPFEEWISWIEPYLDTIHIKDSIFGTKEVVPAGQGEGRIVDSLVYLARKGWMGALAIEPHLSGRGPYGAYSGAENCHIAHEALKDVLARVEAEVNA